MWREKQLAADPDFYKKQYARYRLTSQTASRRWKAENRERHRAYSREWYYAHREYALEQSAARWRMKLAADPAAAYAPARRWRKANALKVNEKTARRRARIKGSTSGPLSYAAILDRDGYVCHICGGVVAVADLSFDHVVPLARGGQHSMDNVKVAHLICNVRKGAH